MKRVGTMLSMVVGVLLLASCGQSTGDRALSGGAIGAGAGAVGGALMGSPGTGALLGGALGAGAGALTSPSQIDLGKPVWER
jgi:osmotically inducible lipoprotein OsmB